MNFYPFKKWRKSSQEETKLVDKVMKIMNQEYVHICWDCLTVYVNKELTYVCDHCVKQQRSFKGACYSTKTDQPIYVTQWMIQMLNNKLMAKGVI